MIWQAMAGRYLIVMLENESEGKGEGYEITREVY